MRMGLVGRPCATSMRHQAAFRLRGAKGYAVWRQRSTPIRNEGAVRRFGVCDRAARLPGMSPGRSGSRSR